MKTARELLMVLEELNERKDSYTGLPFDKTLFGGSQDKGNVAVRIQIYEPLAPDEEESYILYIKLGVGFTEFVYSRQRGLEMLRDVFNEIRIVMSEINSALGMHFDTDIWEA